MGARRLEASQAERRRRALAELRQLTAALERDPRAWAAILEDGSGVVSLESALNRLLFGARDDSALGWYVTLDARLWQLATRYATSLQAFTGEPWTVAGVAQLITTEIGMRLDDTVDLLRIGQRVTHLASVRRLTREGDFEVYVDLRVGQYVNDALDREWTHNGKNVYIGPTDVVRCYLEDAAFMRELLERVEHLTLTPRKKNGPPCPLESQSGPKQRQRANV